MFKGGDFSGHDWSNMSLNKVQFYDVRSVGARFCNTKTWHMGIHESDFSGSDFRSVEGDFLRVYKSSITDAIFDGAILNNWDHGGSETDVRGWDRDKRQRGRRRPTHVRESHV